MSYYIDGIIPDPVQRRVLLSIIAVVSVYGLSLGLLYPLVSLNMEARGFSSTWIGAMGMMPFIASLFASPLTPVIMRKFNVTRLVTTCIVADLFFILTLVAVENIYVWFVVRFLMGVAGTVLFVVSETWMNEIAEDRFRGRIMGIYTLAFSATFAISPLIIVVMGAEGPAPFLVGAGLIAVALIPLRFTRDSKPDFSGGNMSQVMGFVFLAPTLLGAVALMSFEEAAIITLLPIYALRTGATEQVAALFLTVIALGSMAGTPIVGLLADKINRYSLIFACALGVLIGALLLPLVVQTKFLVWLVMFVWGGMIAGIYTVALTIMGQRFRGAQLAAGNAAIGVMWGIAGTTAPGVSGIAMKIWDPHGFVAVVAVVAVLFLLLAFVRRLRARASN